jgi:asparagine synthase (glutamine-hydrolysing)
MSGIVGIINLDGAPVDRDLFRGMTEFMAFRGPDAQEVWIDGNVGFGHTMLRTTWEAETEKQPLTLDGKVWLTADARIDGRKELIAELEAKLGTKLQIPAASNGSGPQSRIPNDAELILFAYQAWGEDCVKHLIGDFAFAIWDSRERKLLCARDHFGFKPLFYARIGNSFLFSNTLDCVRQHPLVSGELNDLAVADFLLFAFNQDLATTTFADVQRVPPAHTLAIRDKSLRIDRYWQPSPFEVVRYKTSDEYVARFKELLQVAVGDRLRSNSAALKMSGGVDSTAVAAFACEVFRQRNVQSELRAYTAVYDRLIPDRERYYSGIAAKALGIPIEYFPADDYKPFDRWEEPELRTPEPVEQLFSAMPHDIDNKVVARTRVALGGLGGDCLGLSLRAYLYDRLSKGKLGELLSEYGGYVVRFWQRTPLNVSRSLKLRLGLTPYPAAVPFPLWLNPELVRRLDLRNRWQTAQAPPSSTDSIRSLSYETFMSNGWASEFEANDPGLTQKNIEYRQPLFDIRLVEYALSVPAVPYWLDKMLLRRSTIGLLPASIRLRPKAVLAGDPVLEYLKTAEAEQINYFKPVTELHNYLVADRVPFVGMKHGNDVDDAEHFAYYQHLRPKALNHWLNRRGIK